MHKRLTVSPVVPVVKLKFEGDASVRTGASVPGFILSENKQPISLTKIQSLITVTGDSRVRTLALPRLEAVQNTKLADSQRVSFQVDNLSYRHARSRGIFLTNLRLNLRKSSIIPCRVLIDLQIDSHCCNLLNPYILA